MKSVLGTGLLYTFTLTHPDGTVERWEQHNLLPQAAVNHMAGLMRGTSSIIANWYLGLFEGNYVPTLDFTSALLQSTAVECTTYSQASRPAWSVSYDGVSSLDNLASEATFTFTADKTVRGAFVVSSATKAGASGLVLSIARFDADKIVSNGSVLSVGAGITLASQA
jgi:hypothetical protein